VGGRFLVRVVGPTTEAPRFDVWVDPGESLGVHFRTGGRYVDPLHSNQVVGQTQTTLAFDKPSLNHGSDVPTL
jgi:hypothetical protein